jgi:predicted HD superfamily hydrolase involved in NAD metabolism
VNQLSVKDIEEEVYKKYGNSKRLNHILGVARLAKELAIKFNLDSEKAYITGLLHDYIKYEAIDEMKRIISDQYIIEKFKDAPQIYHAYASSVMAKEKFNIIDEEILNGIKYHVFGRVDMTLFEKIIVISDFAEDSREYPACKEVRKVLDSGNFDLAMYLCIKYTIESVIANGFKPLEEQYEILEQLKKNI